VFEELAEMDVFQHDLTQQSVVYFKREHGTIIEPIVLFHQNWVPKMDG